VFLVLLCFWSFQKQTVLCFWSYLRLQFEALSQFTADEKKVVKAVIEGLILKHDAQRFTRPQELPA